MKLPQENTNPIKAKALKNGWLNHDLYREADAYVSGYECATNRLMHDFLIYWLCQGVNKE